MITEQRVFKWLSSGLLGCVNLIHRHFLDGHRPDFVAVREMRQAFEKLKEVLDEC